MKLITEHLESDLDFLIEKDEKGNKNTFIEGIFMQAEKQNRNNRIYPKEVLYVCLWFLYEINKQNSIYNFRKWNVIYKSANSLNRTRLRDSF